MDNLYRNTMFYNNWILSRRQNIKKGTHESHLAINVLKYEAMERRISEDTERNPH